MYKVALVLAVALVFATTPVAAQPAHMSYQGQLLQNGVPYDGLAEFKFAIVSSGGTLWSNDGTSSVGNEPQTAVLLPVELGIFHTRLGEPPDYSSPLLPEFFFGSPDPVLRIWVDTGTGFEQLPDAPLSSMLFALQSDAANRALADFFVPGELQLGAGIRFGDNTFMSTVPSGGTGPDSDWTIVGNDMISAVTGNVGIGTGTPNEKLTIVGNALFQYAPDRSLEITTPGGWPGLIGRSVNTHRRDVIFDDIGIRLLAGDSSAAPGASNGIIIDEQGYVGIGVIPSHSLHVNGTAAVDLLRVRPNGTDAVTLWGDPTSGASVEFNGPGGITDKGISFYGASAAGGGVLSMYNAANQATVEFLGELGGGGSLAAANATGTVTYTMAGQAFGGGSQMRLFDSAGAISHEFTAANREMKVFDDAGTVKIKSFGSYSGGEMFFYQNDGQNGITVDGDNGGHGELNIYDDDGQSSVRLVGSDSGGNGRVITDILEIRGGADLSEGFDISGDTTVEPGMVVCIDPLNAGKLTPSSSSYDRKVAGIVSGAGGVRPGMLMGQSGSIAAGAHPVALSGRVWAWCDASDGSIEPGDLLTTSDTPGHAMKAADASRASGSVLGKAMTPLRGDRGLVLVLVNLQ